MKKTLLRVVLVIVILFGSLIAYISVAGNKDFVVPIPDNLHASKDPAVIARGKYLAFGPAHCASCHTPLANKADIDQGKEMPLIGGWAVDIPPGKFRAGNLTPDEETGIGKLTDGQLVRALRYSVNHNNKAMFPFMPFQDMSDEDVVALISFLRSQEPVKNKIEPTEYSLLGKALMTLGAFKPMPAVNTPPVSVPVDSSIVYGEYVAHRVANCVGCHTERDLHTGKALGPLFAGGFRLPADAMSEGYTFITPNLTPDRETGIMGRWSEEAFIARFRKGRVFSGSQMPWGSFLRMSDLELKAVYRYLRTLQPVKNKIEKVAYAPGEKVPA